MAMVDDRAPKRIERDDDLRADASNVTGDFLARLGSIGAIQLAVEIIQQADLTHAELARRRAQLASRPVRQPPARRCAFVVEPPPFTASPWERGLNAFEYFADPPSRATRRRMGNTTSAGLHRHDLSWAAGVVPKFTAEAHRPDPTS
jgi:hypothetical protein